MNVTDDSILVWRPHQHHSFPPPSNSSIVFVSLFVPITSSFRFQATKGERGDLLARNARLVSLSCNQTFLGGIHGNATQRNDKDDPPPHPQPTTTTTTSIGGVAHSQLLLQVPSVCSWRRQSCTFIHTFIHSPCTVH